MPARLFDKPTADKIRRLFLRGGFTYDMLTVRFRTNKTTLRNVIQYRGVYANDKPPVQTEARVHR